MLQSRDFKELLSVLEKHEVRYLVIGGYAVMLYSEPRWTKDLDLWIAIDAANAKAIFNALKEFGAPLTDLTAADFSEPGYFYQMGNPPLRVDVMMQIPGGDFDTAWERRKTVSMGESRIHFIGRDDLIAVKLAAGRDQDLKDVEAIRRSIGNGPSAV
jgi:predicted nucleotidyltransferase